MSIDQAITLALALLGAVLGTVNTWHALDQRRVRLKVSPQYSIPIDARGRELPPMFSIDVANLSAFPVTISEFGFWVSGRRRVPISVFQTLEARDRLPVRLEPHDAICFYFDTAPLLDAPKLGPSYVRTATGVYRSASSEALRDLSQLIEDFRREHP